MEIKELYSIFKACGKVTTDSRAITGGELFFALKGENFDGNDYALPALEKGAAFAVTSEDSEVSRCSDKRIIPVPDTLEALKALARYHRDTATAFGKRLTVIGLTGTNGKTTTKELVTRVLASKYNVTATEGNLNNDIGVPLSLLKINEDTELAVIEMGASHPDDIKSLVSVCDPDYGLVTNVGRGHLLGFGDFEGVKRAKGQLYDHVAAKGGTIFLNADDPVLSEMAGQRKGLNIIEYGLNRWNAILLPSDEQHPFVRMAVPQDPYSEPTGEDTLLGLESHLVGAYNSANILAALAVGLHFGVSMEDGIAAIEAYVPKNNRSQIERTERNVLIEDAYNANPNSMAAALDNLASVRAEHKAALLGNMLELGAESLKEHKAIVEKVAGMGLDLVCLVGEEFRQALEGQENIHYFPTSDELAAWLLANPVSGHTVLIKGSRGTRMEKTIPSL